MSEDHAPATQHAEQPGPPYEWIAFERQNDVYVVYDVPEGLSELYLVCQPNVNPRELARADAVLYEGTLATTYFNENYKTVEFCHTMAGTIDSIPVDKFLDEPAFPLREIPSVGKRPFKELVCHE